MAVNYFSSTEICIVRAYELGANVVIKLERLGSTNWILDQILEVKTPLERSEATRAHPDVPPRVRVPELSERIKPP